MSKIYDIWVGEKFKHYRLQRDMTLEMVNNTYSHLFLDSQQKMAEMLEARMTGINDKEIKALN